MPAKRGTAVKQEALDDDARPGEGGSASSPPPEQTPIGTPQRPVDDSPAVSGGKRKVCLVRVSNIGRLASAATADEEQR
jgi:hypothetical protein